jgi:hypothetical protein
MKKIILFIALTLFFTSISTKSTIQNIDDNAHSHNSRDNTFVITEYSKDIKYG